MCTAFLEYESTNEWSYNFLQKKKKKQMEKKNSTKNTCLGKTAS